MIRGVQKELRGRGNIGHCRGKVPGIKPTGSLKVMAHSNFSGHGELDLIGNLSGLEKRYFKAARLKNVSQDAAGKKRFISVGDTFRPRICRQGSKNPVAAILRTEAFITARKKG